MENTATSMLQLLRSFLDLIRLRLPPQAFPASKFLFLLTAAGFLLATIAYLVLAGFEPWFIAGRAMLGFVNQLAGAWLVLALFNKSARWLQTAIALLGGDTLFAVFALPLIAIGATPDNGLVLWLMLGLMIWQIVFFAHVYRHALDTGLGAGILVGVIYVLVSSTIKQAVLPAPVS